MYLNIETNQYPISEIQIRALYPETSFPVPFQPPSEYKWVFDTPLPEYDFITQELHEVEPILTNKGHYERQWVVGDLSQDRIDANIHLKQQELERHRNSQVVTMRQARLALFQLYLLNDVEQMVEQAPKNIQIEWEYATEVKRGSEVTKQIIAELHWSETLVDELFELAVTL